MFELTPTTDELSNIFAHATAPAFFLGAVAGFVSLLAARLALVRAAIGELIALRASAGDQHQTPEIARLRSRAHRLKKGMLLSLGSGMCAGVLLGIIFAADFLGFSYVYGAGLLFTLATLFLCGAIAVLAWDVVEETRDVKSAP